MKQLYLIQDEATGLSKIGISSDPSRRAKQVGVDSKVIAIFKEAYLEKRLHRFFSEKHIKGEWFENIDTEEIEKAISYIEPTNNIKIS